MFFTASAWFPVGSMLICRAAGLIACWEERPTHLETLIWRQAWRLSRRSRRSRRTWPMDFVVLGICQNGGGGTYGGHVGSILQLPSFRVLVFRLAGCKMNSKCAWQGEAQKCVVFFLVSVANSKTAHSINLAPSRQNKYGDSSCCAGCRPNSKRSILKGRALSNPNGYQIF